MEKQLLIYQTNDGEKHIEVQLREETVWLSLNELSNLFNRDKSVISRHIRNVFTEGELDRESTVAKIATVQIEGEREVERIVEFFNLDVIISVGYRVKSKQGTQFRIWANKILKEYLFKGYVPKKEYQESKNQFLELQRSLTLVENVLDRKKITSDEATGLLKVIIDYAHALELLDQYDHQELTIDAKESGRLDKLTYPEAIEQIGLWRDKQNAGNLFGNEKDASFESSLRTIYQTFDGKDLYPSIEEKAANLLC